MQECKIMGNPYGAHDHWSGMKNTKKEKNTAATEVALEVIEAIFEEIEDV